MDHVKTEWRTIKTSESLHTYISPLSIKIGERKEYFSKNGIQVLEMIPVTIEFVPIRKVLKLFFEIPEIYCETKKYIETLEQKKPLITNFMLCSLWQELLIDFENKEVFPIFLYFDESNNPLGSHRGISKCGAVYIGLPCLPEFMQSKLEKIFLFILFNSLDRKTFSNKVIF